MKSEVSNIDPQELLEHTAWMNRLARRLVLGADRVDDLVQEAWTAALMRPPSSGVPLRAWLAGVMRKRALFGRRSEGRLKSREAQVAQDAGRESSVPSAAELTARTDQQRVLLEHVSELPEKYREVLLLRFFEDMKPAAISKHLGIPVNSVSTRLQRALERMRERLDQEHAGDRQAWSLALVPLAILDRTSVGLLSTLTGNSIGVWIMTQPLKATVLVGLAALAGFGLWQLRAKSVPDLRQFTSAAEAADLLFAPNESVVADSTAERQAVRPARRTIRGKVIDSNGRAVEGAQIDHARPPVYEENIVFSSSYSPSEHSWMTSDAGGTFQGELDASASLPWLEAMHPDYISLGRAQVQADGSEVVLRMAPLRTTTLDVEVIDASSGRRVPRYHFFANIRAPKGTQRERQGWPKVSAEVLDHAGEFEIEFAEGLPLSVQVSVLGLQDGFELTDIRRDVEPVPDGRTVVQFELDLDAPEREPGAVVAFGRVVDDITGEPVAGAEVMAHPVADEAVKAVDEHTPLGKRIRRVQTFADGRFRIALENGGPEATFAVHHPLYQHYGLTRRSDDHQGEFDGIDETEIRLTRRGSIRGLLIDESGQPMPGVPLLCIGDRQESHPSTFEFDTSEHWRKTTDDEGRFELAGLHDRRYRVFVLRGPRDPDEKAIASAGYVLDPGEDRQVVLQVDAPDRVIVRGRVVPPAPLDYGLVPYFLPYEDGAGWIQPKSTATGYEAGGLARGKYLVLLAPAIDDNDGPFALLPEIEIDGFGEQVMNFRYPTGSLEGQVVLAGDPRKLHVLVTPVVPAGFAHDVMRSGKLTSRLSVPVEEDGSFRIEQLASGPHRLQLFAGAVRSNLEPVATQDVEVHGHVRLAPWIPR